MGILLWAMSSLLRSGDRFSRPRGPFIHPMCLTVRVRPLPRRWLIVLALFVVTYGISTPLAAYGVFLPVLAQTFGWSRGAIATALSINLLIGGVAGFGIGALADRHGPRVMLVTTVALAGAAFALVGTVSALWHLYLFVGMLGGGGGCITLLAALTVRLPRTSERSRPRAVAPSASGAQPAAPSVTLAAALTDPRQWYLNASWLLLGGVAMMTSVHVVPFARDQGVSLAGASLTLTAYGLGSVCGRLASGAVSDRLGTVATIRAGYLAQIAALGLLLLVPSSRDVVLASLVVFGIGFAAADTMVTKVIPDVFGVRAIGAIMGVLTLGWRAGAALGPAAAGFLYDATGSYTIPFAAAPVAVLASWGLYALATRR